MTSSVAMRVRADALHEQGVAAGSCGRLAQRGQHLLRAVQARIALLFRLQDADVDVGFGRRAADVDVDGSGRTPRAAWVRPQWCVADRRAAAPHEQREERRIFRVIAPAHSKRGYQRRTRSRTLSALNRDLRQKGAQLLEPRPACARSRVAGVEAARVRDDEDASRPRDRLRLRRRAAAAGAPEVHRVKADADEADDGRSPARDLAGQRGAPAGDLGAGQLRRGFASCADRGW